MPEKFQINYGELQGIGQRFSRQSDEIGILIRRMEAGILDLQHSWSGHGAAAFFGEMDGSVLPGVKRLQQALGQASEACGKIAQVIRQAEEEAGGNFKNDGGSSSNPTGGGSSSGGSSSKDDGSSSTGSSSGKSPSGDGSSAGSASGKSPSGDGSSAGSASGGGSSGSGGGSGSAGGGSGSSSGGSSGGEGGGGGGGSSGSTNFSPSGSSGAFGAASSGGWQGVMSMVNGGGSAQQPFNQLVQSIKTVNPQGAADAFQGILKAAPGLGTGDASPLLGQALSQAFPLQGVSAPTTPQGLNAYINQISSSMGLNMGTSGFANFFDAILHAIVSMISGDSGSA